MPKRECLTSNQLSKKRKMELAPKLAELENITKQKLHPLKENVSWPEADIRELLANIEANIPSKDTVSYSRRLEKLDWANIAFKNHTTKECKEVWNTLNKHVRKFRLLGELVTDIKNMLDQKKSDVRKKTLKRPKKPLNSFMLFSKDKREQVKERNPLLNSVEINKELGKMFKNLPFEEREKYEEFAKVAKQEYFLELEEFYKKHPKMKSKKKSQSLKMDENPKFPENPKTPFQLFVKVELEKEKNEAARAVMYQKCRENWKYMDDRDKYFWINWADEMYTKYREDLKEYIKAHPDYKPEKIQFVLTKTEKQIMDRCSGKPDKPPHGAYHLFSKMIMNNENTKKINQKDLMCYVSEQWRACTPEEKNEYKVRVEQMWEEYHKKLEKYLLTLPPEKRDYVREHESRKKNKESLKLEKGKPVEKQTKPESPPSSPFKYFKRTYTGDDDPESVWEGMSDKHRREFERKLDKERKQYLIKYEEFVKSLDRDELIKLKIAKVEETFSSSSTGSDSEEESEASF